MLQDLPSPHTGDSKTSADCAGTSCNGCGTTSPEPTQEREEVQMPDQCLASIKERVDNNALKMLEKIMHQETKWLFLESDTCSEVQSVYSPAL